LEKLFLDDKRGVCIRGEDRRRRHLATLAQKATVRRASAAPRRQSGGSGLLVAVVKKKVCPRSKRMLLVINARGRFMWWRVSSRKPNEGTRRPERMKRMLIR
jgi:hypothetical protein